jgi:hypothetical protein
MISGTVTVADENLWWWNRHCMTPAFIRRLDPIWLSQSRKGKKSNQVHFSHCGFFKGFRQCEKISSPLAYPLHFDSPTHTQPESPAPVNSGTIIISIGA